jgi:sugar phosphate isomerase/epimerase
MGAEPSCRATSPALAHRNGFPESGSLHLKDRTAEGGNLPWGQGKTPIKEILQLMKKEKWTFPAEIELEYEVPQGSNSVAEVAKRLEYCKDALA